MRRRGLASIGGVKMGIKLGVGCFTLLVGKRWEYLVNTMYALNVEDTGTRG